MNAYKDKRQIMLSAGKTVSSIREWLENDVLAIRCYINIYGCLHYVFAVMWMTDR